MSQNSASMEGDSIVSRLECISILVRPADEDVRRDVEMITFESISGCMTYPYCTLMCMKIDINHKVIEVHFVAGVVLIRGSRLVDIYYAITRREMSYLMVTPLEHLRRDRTDILNVYSIDFKSLDGSS